MIKKEESDKKFYFCQSADWSTVVLAQDEFEAAKLALKSALESLKDETNVGLIMSLKIINEGVEKLDIFIRIDQTLADIGMHKESRALTEIIEENI